MPGFDGTGPGGMGPMTGGGRGFCVIREAGPRYYPYPRYGALPLRWTREPELEFLKSQAEALAAELRDLEAKIAKLSAEKE